MYNTVRACVYINLSFSFQINSEMHVSKHTFHQFYFINIKSTGGPLDAPMKTRRYNYLNVLYKFANMQSRQ